MRNIHITNHALERFIERVPRRFTPPAAYYLLMRWTARGQILSVETARDRGITVSAETQGESVLIAGNARLGWFAWPISSDGAMLTTLNWKPPRPRAKRNAKRFKNPDRWV